MRKLYAAFALLAAFTLSGFGVANAQTPVPGPDTVGCAQATVRVTTAATAAVAAADALAKVQLPLNAQQTAVLALQAKLNDSIDAAKLNPTAENVLAVTTNANALNIGVGVLANLAAAVNPTLKTAVIDANATLDLAIKARVAACTAPPTTPPTTPAPTTSVPVPNDGVNCDELTQAEAQRILMSDKTDPNNLDADKDGIACELPDASVLPDTSSGFDTGDGSTE